LKTAGFGILNIKIPGRMLSVQNRLDTKMSRIYLFSFFTIKAPRDLAALVSFGILIS